MSDDRADRLREQRQKARERAVSGSVDDGGDGAETKKERVGETSSVKDEFVGTYMYLPDEQAQELGPTYKIMSATYEREFEEKIEKNRHFYPLVVQYGLDGLDGLDASEIRERLDELDLL